MSDTFNEACDVLMTQRDEARAARATLLATNARQAEIIEALRAALAPIAALAATADSDPTGYAFVSAAVIRAAKAALELR